MCLQASFLRTSPQQWFARRLHHCFNWGTAVDIFGNTKCEVSRQAGATKYARRKEQERSAACGVFRSNIADVPFLKIHPDSQAGKILTGVVLLQTTRERRLRVTGGALAGMAYEKWRVTIFK